MGEVWGAVQGGLGGGGPEMGGVLCVGGGLYELGGGYILGGVSPRSGR